MLHVCTRPTDQFRDDMDRIFGDVFGGCSSNTAVGTHLENPLVDVWEESDGFVVEAALPGVRDDQLDIQALGRKLTLRGTWPAMEESENPAGPEEEKKAQRKFYRRERRTGEFHRILKFPIDIDTENVEARLADGVLSVKIPKAASAKPRQIQLQTT